MTDKIKNTIDKFEAGYVFTADDFSTTVGEAKSEKMSYNAIPAVVYTNPEIAGVGMTEETVQSLKIPYQKKMLPLSYSGRFVAENEMGNGVCKILTAEDETILGVHILGNPASEIIAIAGIAIAKGMKAQELQSMIFPHPTVGEIIKQTLAQIEDQRP